MPLKDKLYCQTLGCKMGFTLKSIMRLLENEFNEQNVELTLEQYFLLNILDNEEGLILKELAEIVDRDKSAVLRHLKGLEDHRFVARTTDPEDKRRKIIFITKPGHRSLTKARGIEIKINNYVSRDITSDKLDIFENTLSALYNNAT